MNATASLPSCCSKSLKFKDRPDIADLVKQHGLVMANFHEITQFDGCLDLCVNTI